MKYTKSDEVDIRKKLNAITRRVREESKPEKCIICGKKKSSFCNSHSVPRMILKNIAEGGKVLHPSLLMELFAIDIEKGINSSGTFNFICKECDRELFKNYENPDVLEQETFSDEVLSEIALKNTLLVLSKRNQERVLYRILAETGRLEGLDIMNETHDLDERDYKEDMKYHLNVNESSSGKYRILYHKTLPYKVPISAQICLVMDRDLEGRIVNDINNYSKDVKMQNLHICIFPLKKESVILMFHRWDERNYKYFRHQFNCLSEKEKLMTINYLIFKYTENYYLSPQVQSIVENDSSLSLLSRENNGLPNLGFNKLFDEIDYKSVEPNQVTNLLLKEYSIW